MPDTPRWLLLNNRELEAKEVLVNIYDNHVDTTELLESIKTNITEESRNEDGWEQIYHPTPAVKKALIAGVGQGILQQLTGIEAIMNYFIFLFEKASIRVTNAYTYLVIFGFCKFITVAFVSRLFDNPDFGRKKMLLLSGAGITLSMLIFAIVYSPYFSSESWIGPVLITNMFFYVSVFSIGWGPCTWIVIAEVFPTHIRAKGVSAATFANRIMATIISGSFLTLVRYLTYSGVFMVFLGCSLFSLYFTYVHMPETGGISLEDMSNAFKSTHGTDGAGAGAVRRQGQVSLNSSSGEIRSPSFTPGSEQTSSADYSTMSNMANTPDTPGIGQTASPLHDAALMMHPT